MIPDDSKPSTLAVTTTKFSTEIWPTFVGFSSTGSLVFRAFAMQF